MFKRQLYFLLTLLVPSVKADIVLPSFGNLTHVSIGSEIRLPWTLTVDIAKLSIRTWKFSKTGESNDFLTLAVIINDLEPSIVKGPFTGISVTKPATLVLKNASLQHNGTYRFEIDVSGVTNPNPSDIVVVIQEPSKANTSCTGNGDSFSCLCKGIGGNPPPWISWFKNGVKIKGPGYLETKLDKDDFLKGRVGVYYCNSTSGELNNVKEITLSKVLVENVSIKIEPLNPAIGDTVTITCSSTVYPPPAYILYRNGTTIPNNDGVGSESVKEKGAIKYTCEATNIFATVNKSKVVEVKADIVLPSFGNLTYVSIGSEIRLPWTLTVDIAELTTRTWKFSKTGESSDFRTLALIVQNGAPSIFTNTFTGISVTKPATFVLKNASLQHNGTYRFEIDRSPNPNPSPSDILVVIQERPTVVMNCSGNITLNEGDDVTCLCGHTGGKPPPTAIWSKDGNVLLTGYLKAYLVFKNVKPENAGTYKCAVKSHNLQDDKSFKLVVQFKPNITTFERDPKIANFGNDLKITCKAKGVPEPNYIIYHNGSILAGVEDGVKIIQSVEHSDAGNYTCNAGNTLGNDTRSFNLSVTEEPRAQSTSKPTTNNSPKSSEATNTTGAGSSLAAGSITTEWYMFFITLICGICLGMILLYAIQRLCHRIRETMPKDHSKTSETNTNPETHQEGTENISVYQELNLEAMNAEDNYQSLRVSSRQPRHAEAKTEDESNYQELNKDRVYDDSNYQSLKKV